MRRNTTDSRRSTAKSESRDRGADRRVFTNERRSELDRCVNRPAIDSNTVVRLRPTFGERSVVRFGRRRFHGLAEVPDRPLVDPV
jgi:hypothetical protein